MECALYIQNYGASHLLGLPVSKVESDLISFVTESYYPLAPETFLSTFIVSYSDGVSAATANVFTAAAALAKSRFFVAFGWRRSSRW